MGLDPEWPNPQVTMRPERSWGTIEPMTSFETPVSPPEQGTHRALRLAIGAAAVVVLMLGISQFADIVGPFFLALNLMIVVWPVQRFLARHLPRVIAAILSGLLAIVILGLFFWAIGWAASLFVQEIPLYKDEFQSMYDQGLNALSQFGVTSSQIIDQLKGINPSSVVSVVGSLISNVSGVVSLLVIVISVLLFMIVDSVDFEARLERLGAKHNPVLVLALQSFAQGVRSYWVTSTVFGLGVSLLTWAGLAAYGVPLAIVWAVLSFVTNYIPNVGFIIGLVPAAVMGLLAKGPIGALYVIALYAVLNFVIQSVIQPKVTGDAVGVTSTVSFLSLLVWAVVLGPLGALLALPATLFVKALMIDADPKSRWVNALIASNPKTSAEEPIIVTDGADPVGEPLVAPVESAAVGDPDVPRRAAEAEAAETVEEEDDDEDYVSTVIARRSADGDVEEVVPTPVEDLVVESAPVIESVPFVAPDLVPEPVAEPTPVVDQVPGPEDVEEVAEPEEVVEASDDVAEPVAEGEDAEDAEVAESTGDAEVSEIEVTETVESEEAEEIEDEDVPKRARPDASPWDDDPVTEEALPLFQASATPYWHSTVAHGDD